MPDDVNYNEEARPASNSLGYLILDTESVPDGALLSKVKYAGEALSAEEAVRRAQAEAREQSRTNSDFLPVSFHVPVSVCVLRVGSDYSLQRLTALGAPDFRPRDIVEQFWAGVQEHIRHHPKCRLVTYNGRGFDLPLLELAAFRYRITIGGAYYNRSRNRYNRNHLDLMDWFNNLGACRLAGGLNALSKILGKPGKMGVSGDQVYEMYLAGKVQEINDYCMCDTLDTYFVFLRTRVMTGEISGDQEAAFGEAAHAWLRSKSAEIPAVQKYLENWGDWQPWP
jgi:predicted PolB exonuclease-like 3'-5' exonuclease